MEPGPVTPLDVTGPGDTEFFKSSERRVKMSCYHPLLVKNVTPRNVPKGSKMELDFSAVSSQKVAKMLEAQDRLLRLPCGQCIGCRLDYSRQWADRCMLELVYHKQSWFATLTYDDRNLPISYSVDLETGEALSPVATLQRRDFQLFMKKLRKHTRQSVRFFGSGEYGEASFRPHFHVILFGLELNDLVPYKKSVLGFQYWTSETISKAWSDSNGDPRGISVVGQVSWETCAYVARYMVKKVKGRSASDHYAALGIVPEFSMMSLKPAIGRQYYDDHPDLFEYDFINLPGKDGGRKLRHPKYYRRLYEIDDPEGYDDYRSSLVSRAKANVCLKEFLTGREYYDILLQEEELKLKRMKSLIRPDI